jgi:hypothetical protein
LQGWAAEERANKNIGLRDLEYDVPPIAIMHLLLSLLLAGPIYVASSSTIVQSQSQPAIVQSLSTGVYRPATVIFEGHRARIRFNHGGQIVLELDNPVTTESEEIVGVDQNHNFWAVYVDTRAPETGSSTSLTAWWPIPQTDPPAPG